MILAVGAVLRIAWVVYAARPAVGLHDPAFYTVYGNQLAAGNGYTVPNGEPTAYYPVGYPAFLGALFCLLDPTGLADHHVAAYANVVLGTASIALVFAIGRRILDDRAALVGAAVFALWPNLVFHAATALTETLFIALCLLATLVVLGPVGWRRAAAFGAITAVAAEVRPISLLFLPAAALVWLLARQRPWKPLLAATAAIVVVLAPWTIRNAVVMDEPVVLGTNVGDNLCIGSNPDANGGFQLSAYCSAGYDDLPRPEYETRRNAEATDKAIDYLREEPTRQLWLTWKRVFYTVEKDHDGLDAVESYRDDPWLDPDTRRRLSNVADAWFWVVGVLAVVSVPRFLRTADQRLVLAFGIALATAPLPFFGDPRFKVPVTPYLALGAGAAIAAALGRARPTTTPAPAPPPRSTASSSTGPAPGR